MPLIPAVAYMQAQYEEKIALIKLTDNEANNYSHAPLYAKGKYPLTNLSTNYIVISNNTKSNPLLP